MARPEISTAFEHTSLPHGDDGKLVRGIIARCGGPGCTIAAPLPVNVMSKGLFETAEVEWRFIAKKLEAKGWRIGRRRQDHRCPRCQRNAALEKPVNAMAPKLQIVKDNLMSSTTVPPPKTPAPSPSKEMTRDDRRVIFAKLNEVYVDDKVGYGEGWSDEKVASDLGVPRAWVRVVREENFGDELTSENIREKIKEAFEMVASVRKLLPAFEEAKKLFGLVDKMEKQLADIMKSMGIGK